MVSTTCRCGTGARSVVSSHCVQIARRLGRTTGAEVAALAGEREQILVRAGIAADARESVVEHAAGEERVSDLCDHGPTGAVLASEAVIVDRLQAMQMIGHQPKERRRLGPSGVVDATHRRRCIGHPRSGTEERRTYPHRPCRLSPYHCATGCFDAASAT